MTWETLIDERGALVVVYRGFMKPDTATALFEELQSTVPWIRHTVRVYGREVEIPRQVCAYGSVKKHYYSGNYVDVLPWRDDIHKVCIRLNKLGYHFNSCLLNYYEDGQSYIGFHSDTELVDDNVATISLGGSRDFHMKSKGITPTQTIKTTLHNGDLVIMSGTTQNLYTHGIPKRATAEPRISLTFRLLPDV